MPVEPRDAGRLLEALLPEARTVRVRQVTPLLGGWSAETFRVEATCETAGGGSRPLDVVVRRIPEDGLLAPYDVEREERILLALQDSPVPVPAVLGSDPAGEYLGRPCLVTAYVHGEPLAFFGQSTPSGDERLPSYFASLAAIHSLEWRETGLAFLDEADDGVEGELRRAEARLDYHDRLGADERTMLDWLRAHKPPGLVKAFVHGDPNPANYLFAGSQVAAVLDWELALIGDPRLDFGFFAAVQSMFGGAWQLDVASFLRGYAAANPGANLEALDYFEAVGIFRLMGFLHAAERLRSTEAPEGRRRLSERFEQITSGVGDASSVSAALGERGGD